jgi:hypothetical protein
VDRRSTAAGRRVREVNSAPCGKQSKNAAARAGRRLIPRAYGALQKKMQPCHSGFELQNRAASGSEQDAALRMAE